MKLNKGAAQETAASYLIGRLGTRIFFSTSTIAAVCDAAAVVYRGKGETPIRQTEAALKSITSTSPLALQSYGKR